MSEDRERSRVSAGSCCVAQLTLGSAEVEATDGGTRGSPGCGGAARSSPCPRRAA